MGCSGLAIATAMDFSGLAPVLRNPRVSLVNFGAHQWFLNFRTLDIKCPQCVVLFVEYFC